MSNEQLVILIKAGEDTAQNMERLYSQGKGIYPYRSLEI